MSVGLVLYRINKANFEDRFMGIDGTGLLRFLHGLLADMHYGTGMMNRCSDILETEFEHCSDLNTTLFLKRFEYEKLDFKFLGNIFEKA
ncbi:hypothetical protein LguiA_004941 [Lonicera macranthoides]